MSKKYDILIFLADGFEEIEAVTTIDILRRAGVEVIVAGVGHKTVKGAYGLEVMTERDIKEISAENIDMLILPGGGGGVDNLCKSTHVASLLQEMKKSKYL